MMTRNTSRKVAILKQIALIPLIATIGFLLSVRAIAQDKPKQQTPQKQTTSNKVDASKSVIKEYFAILSKYKVDTLAFYSLGIIYHSKEELDNWLKKTHIDTLAKISTAERNRLGDLFAQMSKKQQNHACVYFKTKPELRKKIVPTKEEFEAWKNDKVYGIWIDSTRVENSILNSHSNTDFVYFETFKMGPASARVVHCKIKIMLLTETTLEKENKRISYWRNMESSKYMIVMAPHILVSKTNSKKTK